ncbi:hypothetical protein L1887_32085 [Cichorium endivia]|nr:hypothetical protein L1887_32085 [Cichorium endivia]
MAVSNASPLSFVSEPMSEHDERLKENLGLLLDRYKDKFTTLPKEKGWMGQNLYMYQGFWYMSNTALSVETTMAMQFTHINLSPMTIEEMFEAFIKGMVPYGSYWDRVKDYYKISREHPTRILFLTYEVLKMDTSNQVKRLAEFMDANKHGNYNEFVPNAAFFREGEVGGWRKDLIPEMSQILDDITKEKFQVLGLTIFRVKNPEINMNSAAIIGLDRVNAADLLTGKANLTVVADVSVKNTNVAPFKRSGGVAKARRTMRLNLTFEVTVAEIAGNHQFGSDLASGILPVESYTKFNGRVNILNIIKKKATFTGGFIAVSRYASATHMPPSILSRGVGILSSGVFGTVNGSSVSIENAGLLALTRVGSRRVVQISAGFMIVFNSPVTKSS